MEQFGQFKVPRRPRPKETGNMDCTANIREALFRSTKTICLIRPRDLVKFFLVTWRDINFLYFQNYEESIMQELDETNIMDMQEFDETTNTDITSNVRKTHFKTYPSLPIKNLLI